MDFKKEHLLLFGIILVATILRFWNFSQLPFTHDEFSTLFRLNYDSLNEVIQIGMKQLDNHPIGTQVFYYYYTKVFGFSEIAMKFPIALFGVFSVFMVFLLGKKWFNETAGLYAASFFAVLQYTVAQSQIARMYGFGIPFVLLTVYFWRYLLESDFKFKNALGFILSAAMCSYNHYFSLLFVAVVGVTGLFLVQKKNLKYYLISCTIIVALFVPHLNIFIYQLSKGGIEGWLGAFRLGYFFKYMAIVFNLSYFIGVLVVVFPIFFLEKVKKVTSINYRLISLIWFLVPMLIGFTYSYFVSNVIHERVLYFSFPFLLLFISSFIKEVSFNKKAVMVSLILAVGVASLSFERQHTKMFINHRYKNVAETCYNWTKDLNPSNVLIVKATYDKVDNYYNEKLGFNYQSNYIDKSVSYKTFIELIENSSCDYLYFGRGTILNATYLQIARDYYPEIIKQKFVTAGESYLLKRGNDYTNANYDVYSSSDREFRKNSLDSSLYLELNETYLLTQQIALDSITFSRNNVIELSVEFSQLDSIGGAKLVSTLEKKGVIIDWRSTEFNDALIYDSINNKAYLSVYLPDIRFSRNIIGKFYVWNPNNSKYKLSNIDVRVKPGNPYAYAGTRKIPLKKQRYCFVE